MDTNFLQELLLAPWQQEKPEVPHQDPMREWVERAARAAEQDPEFLGRLETNLRLRLGKAPRVAAWPGVARHGFMEVRNGNKD